MYKYNPLIVGKLDQIGANELNDLDDVNTAGTVGGYVLTYGTTLDTWTPKSAGAGDMLKSIYDTGDDGVVDNSERLEGDTLATVQAHNVAASKITSGTFGLARIPTMDDAKIPNLETLSYGAAFAEGQIPNLPTTKITSGTLDLVRIPSITNAYLAGEITSDKISALSGTAITYPLNADTVGTTAIKAAGVGNDELSASGLDISKCTVGTAGVARIPSLPTARITTGTFGLARIPTMDDAHIPDLDTLSYGAAFAVGQIPNLAASKITTGTFGLARIPAVDDARIPNLETLSYGGAFATAQIPAIGAYKITTGTFTADRIPALANLKGTVTDAKIPNLETLSYGAAFAAAQIPNLDSSKVTTGTFNADRIPILPTSRITSGTFNLNRIPAVDDARIPNLETLSYGGAFATAQIPAIGAYKITSGTLAVARHETLDNLNGTVALTQVPTMDDAHIPDLETLSYGAAFATAQIPTVGAYKVGSGTLGADRIPALPTARITTGTFNSDRIPILPTDRYGSAVLLTGAQSIGGTKTFSDIPILPASDPTADNEAARKAYVDSAAGAVTEGTYTTSFTFGSAQAVQDAGTAFTIGGFMTHGYIKEVKFRANYTAGTCSTVSGKVNNASGILAAGTVIANDGRSGTFLIGDYIESENEIMRISGTVSPGTLIVGRAKKGSGAAFIDDNEDIVRSNSGFTMQLFKNSTKNKHEMPLMLSSLMTAKGVTDASISSGNKRIELSADLKNVDNLDTIRIDDGASSEEALVQNNVGDCVAAGYDFNIYVSDALGSHASGKTVEKVCKYDIPANYKSTAGTLYGRIHIMEANLGSNLSIDIDIKTDEF